MSTRLLLRWAALADEVMGLVEIGAHCYVEEADHHFIVGLIAPANGGVGIGIVGIIFGIVVPGDGLQHGASGQRAAVGRGDN